MTRPTTADLADSLDELFMELADLRAEVHGIADLLKNRDAHYLKLGAHLERLLAKDREQMRALGLLKLVERANVAPLVHAAELTTEQASRELAETVMRRKAAPLFEKIKNSPLMKPKETKP
jgi:hypothetical protein